MDVETRIALLEKSQAHHADSLERMGQVQSEILKSLQGIERAMPGLVETRQWFVSAMLLISAAVLTGLVGMVVVK